MVRTPIKHDVVGKRIKLIRTDDPYTDLKPGDKGTVIDILSYRMKIHLSRLWFSGIMVRDLQSWKDTMIIGWFMTMIIRC
ncbi:MAG TPA: hypothetical protein VJ225_03545 [Nitrososphaeraceae archaeon]|nr:hypothetical protein [Nitrososphaeraceae archaeon]